MTAQGAVGTLPGPREEKLLWGDGIVAKTHEVSIKCTVPNHWALWKLADELQDTFLEVRKCISSCRREGRCPCKAAFAVGC